MSAPATDWESLPLLLTPAEVRGVLRCGRNQVYEMLRRGDLPCVRMGNRLLVPRDRLRQAIEADGSQGLAA